MAAQRQIPGGPFVNETVTAQAQIPGGPFVNETAAAGPATFNDGVTEGTATAADTPSAGAAGSHATDGVLTGPGSTVAGTAAHLTLHTTTGALTGAGSTVVGAAVHPHTTTGVLAGAGSTVVGAAVHPHTTTGAITGAGSAVVGSADHPAPGGTHPTDGVLTGAGASVAGTAAHLLLHTTTGVLTGPGSSVSGTATRLALHTTTGILVGPGSSMTGAASLNGAVPTTSSPQVGGGRSRKARPRRRVIVEIDGEEFEVRSEQEGMELLLRARELAAEKAQEDAAKAATKAATKAKPAAQNRALAVPIPQVRLVSPDMGDELAQQMQASVDATNAYFEQVYGQALSVARRRVVEMLQDEEDAITVLLLG